LLYGGAGKKKAADLQIENEAKLLKDLIRGLGANKTENSIISKVVGGLTCMILVMPGASIPIPQWPKSIVLSALLLLIQK
jgi:hypothetical protein